MLNQLEYETFTVTITEHEGVTSRVGDDAFAFPRNPETFEEGGIFAPELAWPMP